MVLRWLTPKPSPNLYEWHDWFAWTPVKAWDRAQGRHATVWLETVRRRKRTAQTAWRGYTWLEHERFYNPGM
jgi:hypothetical protein